MNTSKIALWWHNIWRNETKNNVALCVVSIIAVVIVWVLITLIGGYEWRATFQSMMKVGNTPGLSMGTNLLLGLIGSIVITPFVFATITVWIRHRAQKVQLGQKRYRWVRDHYVMIGYNPYSASIILNLLGKKENETAPLIILTTQRPKAIRSEIRTMLPPSIENRVIIYAGSPESETQIRQLNLGCARGVYVALDGKEWDSAYTRSLSVLPTIAKYAKRSEDGRLLPVNLLINDTTGYEITHTLTLPEAYKQHEGKQTLDVHITNFYENWARLLWSYSGLKDKDGKYVYDRLDFEPLEGTEKYVHLVLVGFNDMGKALMTEAIRVAHYPNYNARTGTGKTRITIIDPQSGAYKRSFEAAYPHLAEQVADVELEFVSSAIEDSAIREQLGKWARDKQQLLTIAICMKEPDKAMQTALALPEEVYFETEGGELRHRSRVLVRQTLRSDLQSMLDANGVRYANLKTFGMYYEGTNIDFLDDSMAVFVNGLYSERFYDDIKSVGEIARVDVRRKYPEWLVKWYQVAEVDRQKTRYQIDMYRSFFAYMERNGVPMGAMVTDQAVIETLAEVEHRRWIAQASLLGYRQARAGEKRQNEVKIHTCIIPYEELTRVEQLKDHVVIISAPILHEWEQQIDK